MIRRDLLITAAASIIGISIDVLQRHDAATQMIAVGIVKKPTKVVHDQFCIFAVIETRCLGLIPLNIDDDVFPAMARESLGHREGQVCRWWLLGVPFGLPTLEGAFEAATAPVGGRLVRDAVVTSDHSVWVVVGQNCYTIKGEVFR